MYNITRLCVYRQSTSATAALPLSPSSVNQISPLVSFIEPPPLTHTHTHTHALHSDLMPISFLQSLSWTFTLSLWLLSCLIALSLSPSLSHSISFVNGSLALACICMGRSQYGVLLGGRLRERRRISFPYITRPFLQAARETENTGKWIYLCMVLSKISPSS